VAKPKFKINNWTAYNKSTYQSGLADFWFDEPAIQA
jgi:hypothetical protein